MNQQVTKAIVLKRINYGEADRIITVLTLDCGKLRLMVKAARRVNSKLAGGIEFFSVSNISFVRGRGEIGTLTSARLIDHFGEIAKDIERTMAGYQFIKQVDKLTEDESDDTWFNLLQQTMKILNNKTISLESIHIWFSLQLLRHSGNVPELDKDEFGKKLLPDVDYDFDYQKMTFRLSPKGSYSSDHIKFLRLTLVSVSPRALQDSESNDKIISDSLVLLSTMIKLHLS